MRATLTIVAGDALDRVKFMQERLCRDGVGIEIGPLHQAICPKRDGWNTYVLDAFTAEQLQERYASDQC